VVPPPPPRPSAPATNERCGWPDDRLAGSGERSSELSLAPAELRWIARTLAAPARDLAYLAAGGEREWRLVAESDAFEAWVIGWPVSGRLELHDHGGSRGVVNVVAGSLLETSVAHVGNRLALRKRTGSSATRPLSIGAGRIHDVRNVGPGRALSVHVYSPRLTSMTFFELAHDRLLAHRTEHLGASEEATDRRVS
jgi:hypothetical protein